ncbi:hypothetical protein [Spirillospora sp. NPDC047279]|uniref:DUF7144 family membrane protein n=1 Tax=Spirillospora sp. NPDC047279 TaxID=3155478 RepID=UPI0033EC6537
MSEQMSAARQGTDPPVEPEPVSGWVVGMVVFAAIMMVMIGAFQAIQGLAAVLKDQFYVVAPNYVFDIDVTAWGWTHMVLGVLLAVTGFFVLSGRAWARAVGIVFAVLNAVSQFLFLPYYPVWSILMIVLDVAVIWALCVYGRQEAEEAGY